MPFVLDASIVHAWAFDEASAIADACRARLRSDRAIVPSLWWFELRNGLVMAERRRRSTETATGRSLDDLARLAIAADPVPQDDGVLALARRHRLTVYDASYLELAERLRLPLATVGTPLAAAAQTDGIALLGA